MDLNMLLLKFGLIVLFNFPMVQLAKGLEDDTMEFSDFTFTWEDAEARCARQGQILVPGRRYRAKLLKRWMDKKNVQSIWMNGWRSVSDTVPDADGKLRTLKVDFSRPHNKDIKVVCQIDSVFYDPYYNAKSTEDARKICAKDGAVLADIRSEEDVKGVTEAIFVDTPNWVNSISSQGKSGYYITSKIKQCLIAERDGDDLKYNYVDCSKEFSFICVTDDNLIASFSPLISLKMARYDEFEEEIEKLKQDQTSSFDLFEPVSSTDIFLEMSSTKIMIQSTTTAVTSATPTTTLNQTTTVIQMPDILTSMQPVLTSSESLMDLTTSEVPLESTTERTPSIKPIDKFSEVTTSEIPVYVTKKDIVIDMQTSDDAPMITSSEKSPESISVTSKILETPFPEIIVTSKSSAMVDSARVSSLPETFPEAKTTDVGVDLYFSSSSSDQDSFTITPSETFDDLSPSSSLPVSDSSVSDKSDSEPPKSQIATQSYNLYQTSSSDTKFPQSSFYTDMAVDAKSPYVDVIVTDPLPIQTSTVVISPSSPSDMKQSSTDDYYEYYTDDYEDETSTSSPLPGLESSQTKEYTTETKPVVIVSPVVSEQSMSEYTDMYSHASKAIETVTSPTASLSQVYVDIPSSMSPSERYILMPGEPTTTSFECTVIDATSYCPDTTSTTATLDSSLLTQKTKPQTDRMMETTFSSPPSSTLDYPIVIDIDKDSEYLQPSSITPTTGVTPSLSEYDYDYPYPDKDESYEYDDDDDNDNQSSKSHTPMSATPTKDVTPSMTEYNVYEYPDKDESYEHDEDDDNDNQSSKSHIPMSATPTTDVTPSMTEYYVYEYTDKDESYEYDDDDDKDRESSKPYMPMSTTPIMIDYDYGHKYPDTDESYEFDDDDDTMKKGDKEITGEIDAGKTEDYNEVGNESGDTGEVVGKKAEEEEEGLEVGLWVAFGILILLVLVALILALYLYRRRKMQKSKDISATNGSAAAGATSGETVELRDSRSPSRENGPPRESTTFKDPAYDI